MDINLHVVGRLAAAALGVAIAAACGGGGGGGVGPTAPAIPPGPEVPGPVAPPPPLPGPGGDVPPFSFSSAFVVIGQADFDDAKPQNSLTHFQFPEGAPAVMDDGRLFVPDEGGLKLFGNYDQASAPTADSNVGQFFSAFARGNRLVAVSLSSGRPFLRIFNTAPTAPGATPDVSSSGVEDCSQGGLDTPIDAYITPGGRLLVADFLNNRVLVWNTIPASGPLGNPQLVIGQRDMTLCAHNDDLGDGIPDWDPGFDPLNTRPTGRTLNRPTSVWSDDQKLIIADHGNHRVLIWDSFPAGSDVPASRAIGQADLFNRLVNRDAGPSAISLAGPQGVAVSRTGQLAVADRANHRVLIWDSIPADFDVPAQHVIGQADFDEGLALDPPNENSLREPTAVRFDKGNLIVVDRRNHRVLVWRSEN